jgi:ribulose-phosphate 3-epimerase
VRALARGRAEVVVDGGIRRHTVPVLADAGADGVVPGSLVFAAPDPRAAVAWIQQGRT